MLLTRMLRQIEKSGLSFLYFKVSKKMDVHEKLDGLSQLFRKECFPV